MDRIANLLAAAGLALPALLLTGCAASTTAQPTAVPGGSTAAAAPGPPSTATASTRTMATASARSPASSAKPVRFRLLVRTAAGAIDTAVAPLSVASHQPVDPPHNTALQWDTAAWIVQAAYPARPSRGTTYIYGHACHHHVCPFTNLRDTRIGDTARITTGAAVFTYRIDRIALVPKTATALPNWAADISVRNRIVLVTCHYEHGDTSEHNLVVAAHVVR